MPKLPNFLTLLSRFPRSSHHRYGNGKRGIHRRRRLVTERLEDRDLLAVDYSLIDTDPHGYTYFNHTAVVGTDIYFGEADPVYGVELKKLDTLTGTKTLVADIFPGMGDSLVGEYQFALVGTKLFFSAYDPINGQELRWIDTTLAQPMLHTLDIDQGTDSSFAGAYGFAVSGSKLYFGGYSSTTGQDLQWLDASLDMPVVNTIDIIPGVNDSGAGIDSNLIVIGNNVYFDAIMPTDGRRLVYFDTTADTPEIKTVDLRVNGDNSTGNVDADSFFAIGTKLYFTTNTDKSDGYFRWIDTADATHTVHMVSSSEGAFTNVGIEGGYVAVGSYLYFTANNAAKGQELFWIDTALDPSAMHSIDIYAGTAGSHPGMVGGYVTSGSKLYFTAADSANNYRLRWIDTSVSPSVVNSITASTTDVGSYAGLITGFGMLGNRVYFSATDSATNSYILQWIDTTLPTPVIHSVGVSPGTNVATDYNRFTRVGDKLYFMASQDRQDYDLYSVQNTTDGVTLDHDSIYSGEGINDPRTFAQQSVTAGSKMYFISYQVYNGYQLQWFDTALPNPVVHDVATADASSDLTLIGTKLFYFRIDSGSRVLVWIDTALDVPVVNVVSGVSFASTADSAQIELTAVGSRLYFVAKNSDSKSQLGWIDATSSAPTVNWTAATGLTILSYASGTQAVDGRLYFVANDAVNGTELRWIDTLAAPSVIKTIDFSLGGGSSFDIATTPDFQLIGNNLYFFAANANGNNLKQLRWIDTEASTPTVKVVNVVAGGQAIQIKEYMQVDDKIYVIGTDSSGLDQIAWFSSNTDTPIVTSVALPASVGDYFGTMMRVGDYLYLSTGTKQYANSFGLAMIDTVKTPSQLQSLGVAYSYQPAGSSGYVAMGDKLYFFAADDYYGFALRQLDTTASTIQVVNVNRTFNASNDVADSLITTVGNNVYFSAKKPGFGYELFAIAGGTQSSGPTAIQLSNASVNENMAAGTTVGTLSATDANSSDTLTYTLVNGDGDTDNGVFTINGNILKTTAIFDYETRSTYSIRVRVSDQSNRSFEKVFVISVLNVADQAVTAPLDSNSAANSVPENAAIGTAVGITAHATDADASDTVSYQIIGGSGLGKFAIDPATGVVTTASTDLDTDTDPALVITVKATSTDGSTATTSFTINVTAVNTHDVGVPVDNDSASNSLPENSSVGKYVGITAKATDPDTTQNTVTYSLTNSANGRFAIDPNTGAITLAIANLDYEAQTSFTITVKATSADGSSATSDFTISITDVDEFDVTAPTDINDVATNLLENSAVGTVVGITASATDADGTNNAVTYSLTDTANGRFTINPTTGVVTLAIANLNYEAQKSFTITVKATSADGSTATSNFTVNVTDVDEFDVTAPTDTNTAANGLPENSPVGSVVGITASATDADGSKNAITYSLTDSANGRFAINPTTGVVTLAIANLNYEAQASFIIAVKAASADGSTATTSFTINVIDVDEFDVTAPTDTNAAANSLPENSTVGAVVGITTSATDADGSNNTVTYSLIDSANGRFAINPATGVVTLAVANLNYETQTSFIIAVKATSADGSTATTSFTINVIDVDEFDVTSPTDTNSASNSLPENSAVGTLVGITASATDTDGTNNAVTYSLTDSANGRFAINPTTGVVTLATANLNYEAQTSFTITVKAASADGSTATTDFTINVSNVDEIPVAVADSYTVPLDHTLTVTASNSVLVNDQRADSNTLTASIVSPPTKGAITLNADGTFTYTPASTAEIDQTDTFTYRISEPDGSLSQPATVTIHFTASEGSSLHNELNPMDVDPGSSPGVVTSLDVLPIFNIINAHPGKSSIPVSELPATGYYYDVNNDYRVSSLDALLIINYLNSQHHTASGEGESTPSNAASQTTPTQAQLIDTALADLNALADLTDLPNKKRT